MSSGNSDRMRRFHERGKLATTFGHGFFDCQKTVQSQIAETIIEQCKNDASREDVLVAATRLGLLVNPELKQEAEALLAADEALRTKRKVSAAKSRHLKDAARRAEEQWTKING